MNTIKNTIWRIRRKIFLGLARYFAAKIGHVPVYEPHLRKLCNWQPCMSYNDSYFGEPNGLLKGLVNEMRHELPVRPLVAAKRSAGA